MSAKRPPSPTLIPNPFIKKRNLDWSLDIPQTDSPPSPKDPPSPSTAAIEAGTATLDDHLSHFTTDIASHILPSTTPLLPIPAFSSLYESQAGNPQGAHFVIHQHNHPVAGVHYDLRLQINETSSVSWAIMYGLPGDPNSTHPNRNAAETRIHCLWNHLIETASAATGSLLIWDTGTYTILPRRSKHAPSEDPSSPPSSPPPYQTPQALLHAAFQDRKIRLRLHGSKLPDPYVVNLRLTRSEDAQGRARPSRRRRRNTVQAPETSSDSDSDSVVNPGEQDADAGKDLSAMDKELREIEDDQVRRTNAYPGAENTIGSVDRRRWYMSLDRAGCGLVERRADSTSRWVVGDEANGHTGALDDDTIQGGRLSFPFQVLGVDHETSVVTGRRGEDIMKDEQVTGFVQRKGWKPILE